MPRRKLTLQDRIKGARSLLRSTKKVPEHFKKSARELLKQHGYAVALAFALLLLPSMAHAQREQVRYVSQFYNGGANSTVGAMYTAAQASCVADANIPCIVVADSTLAIYPAGVIPTPCAQCIFIDYRTIGQVQFASNAAPVLASAFGIAYPLAVPHSTLCTTPSPKIAADNDATTGLQFDNQTFTVCILGVRKHVFNNTNIRTGSGVIVCWSSNTDAGVAGCDTGLSRGAAGEVDCGTGAAANKSCDFRAATATFTGAITVASCAGCGGGVGVVSFFCTGIPANSAVQFIPNAGGTVCNNGLTEVTRKATRNGTFQNMFVNARVAGFAAGSGIIVLRVNGADTGVTCTTGTTATCNDTTHTAAITQGQTYSVKYSGVASETLTDLQIDVGFQ